MALKIDTEQDAVPTAFSPDGSLFAVGDAHVELWDLEAMVSAGRFPAPKQAEVRMGDKRFPVDLSVEGLAFSGNAAVLAAWAATSEDRKHDLFGSVVHFWELQGGPNGATAAQKPSEVYQRDHQIAEIALDQKGDRAAFLTAKTSPRPDLVQLFSVKRMTVVREWSTEGIGQPTAVALSPAGDELAVAVSDKIVLFDVKTPLETAVANPGTPVNVSVPPGFADAPEPSPPEVPAELLAQAEPAYAEMKGFVAQCALPEEAGAVRSLRFSSDGRTLAVGVETRRFLVFDADSQKLDYEIRYALPNGLQKDFHMSEWVVPPSNALAAFLRTDGVLCLFDRDPGSEPVVLNKRTSGSRSYSGRPTAAFSPDGRLLCVSRTARTRLSPTAKPLVEVWDLGQGTLIDDVEGFEGKVTHVAFAPNGSLLACVDSKVHLFDPTRDFAPLGKLQPPRAESARNDSLDPAQSSLAVAADGKTVAVSIRQMMYRPSREVDSVYLWSSQQGLDKLESDAPARDFPHPGLIKALALSSDGRRLITAFEDRFLGENWVHVSDTQSREVVGRLGPLDFGRDPDAFCLALDPDDRRFAVSVRGKILLFDVDKMVGQ